ncbi:S1 RNA-binding domain-containing protein [Kitasatospora sp. NPDC086009]|uniref:S1 RNA-binding domain-containing protein n=1 Tax=unclassified Kitasatospora TaxID=2633591 RepID=UPI0037C9A8EF
MLPYLYRITKYDPADRDERGYYTGAVEAVSDHGPVEAAYLEAIAAFAEDTGVRYMAIREPQAALGFVHFGSESAVEDGALAGLFPSDLTGFHDGAQVPVPAGLELVRAMLRGDSAWCRLEVEDTFAVHVGWDQYVYVGSNVPCEAALARTRELGLFPEPLDASPYEAHFDEPGEQRPADDVFWARARWCVAIREAALLEEMHVDNASRWHRLGDGTLDAVRARLTPRARLAVWPDLSTDVAAVLAGLPDEGLVECVWEDQDGRITSTVADETQFTALAAQVRGARAAAVLPMDVNGRSPLFTAVLPHGDGVLRARWRTEPTPSDRDWSFLKTLRRSQSVTGTVTDIADFGVTFVDIGGFTAMINIPELSWRPINHPRRPEHPATPLHVAKNKVPAAPKRLGLSICATQHEHNERPLGPRRRRARPAVPAAARRPRPAERPADDPGRRRHPPAARHRAGWTACPCDDTDCRQTAALYAASPPTSWTSSASRPLAPLADPARRLTRHPPRPPRARLPAHRGAGPSSHAWTKETAMPTLHYTPAAARTLHCLEQGRRADSVKPARRGPAPPGPAHPPLPCAARPRGPPRLGFLHRDRRRRLAHLLDLGPGRHRPSRPRLPGRRGAHRAADRPTPVIAVSARLPPVTRYPGCVTVSDERLRRLCDRLWDRWMDLFGADSDSAERVWARLEWVNQVIERRKQGTAALDRTRSRVIGDMLRENGYRPVRSVVSGGRPESNRARF